MPDKKTYTEIQAKVGKVVGEVSALTPAQRETNARQILGLSETPLNPEDSLAGTPKETVLTEAALQEALKR